MMWFAAAILVYCCHVVSVTALKATPLNAPICVVGAGASGLGTVLALNQKGYKNIVVFEKNAGPGGKAKNWVDPAGIALHLGPVLGAGGYKRVLQIATDLNVPITNVSIIPNLQLFNYDTDTIIPYKFLPLDVAAFTGAIAKYVALWKNYSSFIVPGFTNGVPTEIAGPFSTWLVSNRLEPLLPLLYITISLFGYGSLAKLPTALGLTYILPETIEALAGFAQLFEIDYALLLTKLASSVSAKFIYNAVITKTTRNSAGVIISYNSPQVTPSVKGKANKKNGKGSKPRQMKCSSLVVAFSQRLDLLQNFDLDKEETAVFQEVKTNQYFTTVLKMRNDVEPFLRADILQLSGKTTPPFVVSQPIGSGQPCFYGYRSTYALYSEYGVAYSWKDSEMNGSNVPISLASVQSLLLSSLSPLNRNASQPVSQAVPFTNNDIAVTKAYYDYHPHFNTTSIQNGMFDKLDRLQGHRSTYYTSALRTFELVEAVLESSFDLVDKYF